MKFIGLDVHMETVAVASDDAAWDGEVRFYGTIPNTPDAIRRLFDWLSGSGAGLHFCYEAGGCGYGIYRQPPKLNIAPSNGLITKQGMIKGIASGTVTYEAYRAWVDAPDDKRVTFPDSN
ncbi:hypothetical protein [Rhizobium sp. LjRoot258]|uniref:hypothetical protein n=1 Tax=Rhizobium sp. LjRoot258 TaxID=3342299 RepID=UPI003ECEADF6